MTNNYHLDQRSGSAPSYVVHATQIENEQRAQRGWGILPGVTTETASAQRGAGANMSVDIGEGALRVNSDLTVLVSPPSNVSVSSAHASKARLDALVFGGGSFAVRSGNMESSAGAGDYYPPDLNASEILHSFVLVQGGASSISNSDITDKRIFIQTDFMMPGLTGDGSDGAITDSGNGNRSGALNCTTYTQNAGVATTVNDKSLLIMATEKITINGTITASGQGGSGGAGGSSDGQVGSVGFGLFNANSVGSGGAGASGAGGDGSAGGAGAGGGGGADQTGSDAGGAGGAGKTGDQNHLMRWFPNSAYGLLVGLFSGAGSGGGGGGAGAEGSGNQGAGGAGGAGGGAIILISPVVEITGTVNVSGSNGSNGSNGPTSDAGAGGGGGGGNGGIVMIISPGLVDTNATYTLSGGNGGSAGTGTNGGDGGAGGTGASGAVIRHN